ncbi:MAG: hypothetical protein LBT50_07390 [Prevotellaceae bacterium]|jgi:hypothetical protein|nr:hypothetical protein [Prevotellaceae bacterium]
MKVYIVGEDPVTYAIIKKALAYCAEDFEIIAELPARGGQIKSKMTEFNTLSSYYPVILLMDLDNNGCAPQFVGKMITDKNQNFIINVAVDEAEAWLMADRKGFADYFKIMMSDMPSAYQTKQGGRKSVIEMNFAYKSSMYLTHELIKKSKNSEFVQQLTPKEGAAKGPEYNSCILPFIQTAWNIDNARQNANSLDRMIIRLQNLIQKQ